VLVFYHFFHFWFWPGDQHLLNAVRDVDVGWSETFFWCVIFLSLRIGNVPVVLFVIDGTVARYCRFRFFRGLWTSASRQPTVLVIIYYKRCRKNIDSVDVLLNIANVVIFTNRTSADEKVATASLLWYCTEHVIFFLFGLSALDPRIQ